MANHLHNGPCFRCGSKDNLATYDDGSKWCWGCHYYSPPTISPLIAKRNINVREETTKLLPESSRGSFTTELSQATVQWINKYGISVEEGLSRGIRSQQGQSKTIILLPELELVRRSFLEEYRSCDSNSASRVSNKTTSHRSRDAGVEEETTKTTGGDEGADQVTGKDLYVPRVCSTATDPGNLRRLGSTTNSTTTTYGRVYQSRDHRENAKQKYFTEGDVSTLLPIYLAKDSLYPGRIVLTEDSLSAIKIARYCDSMPCLGSGTSPRKLARLRPFYEVLDVFLDPNMWDNCIRLSNKARLIGFKSRPMLKDKDPKEYSDEEILAFLQEGY